MLRRRWAACGLALAALAGCGGSYKDRVYRLPPAERDVLCKQTAAATEQMAEDAKAKGLNFPKDAQRAGQEACQNAQYVVPPSGPNASPAVNGNGCAGGPHSEEQTPRISRRAVTKPRGLQAPFAPRAGKLPADGPASVGGVDLPSGSRCGNRWVIDEATPRAISLARHLATAFPQTGLWPVIWADQDDPDASLLAGTDPAKADDLDVHGVLQKVWNGALPPLASPSKGTPPLDPFSMLERSLEAQNRGGSYVLMLVPVHRPADAASVLGAIESEVISDPQATAVMRSWQERFGAVLTEVGPGGVGLAIGSPPTGKDQALALATEQMAFTPDDAEPDELPAIAESLLSGARSYPVARDFWSFGWPD